MESSAPQMRYKGRIEIGADADITIFNPNTIIDKATVKKHFRAFCWSGICNYKWSNS